MTLSDFTIVRRSLAARSFASATTIATVAVAVALLLVLLGMKDAGRQAFSRGTGNVELLISRDASPLVSVLNGMFYADAPRRPIPMGDYARISSVQPFEFAVPIAVGDTYRGLPVVATTREYFTAFQPAPDEVWTLAEGELFERSFEIVAGARAAEASGIRIGDTVALTHGSGEGAHVHDEYAFTVTGILAPTRTVHDRALFTDLESSWILHAHDRRLADGADDLTTREDLLATDMLVTGIYAKVIARRGSATSAVLPSVFAALRADPTITVASPADEIGKLFAIVSGVDRILLGMAGVVMLSSAVSIMLAVYASTEQRRRQIAILRVLGSSRGRIFGLVVTESALLGLAGAILGVALGLGGSIVVSSILQERYGLVIEPSYDPRWILLVVAGAIVLACVAGLVPAMKAYRIPVVRHLRPID